MNAQQVRQVISDQIQSYGQSGFLITLKNRKRIYVDPFLLPENPPAADYVSLTHPHQDHYDPKAVGTGVLGDNTKVIALKDLPQIATDVVGVGDVSARIFPAYNRRGFPHPRVKGWIGYLLSFDSVRVYHRGDTDSWL